MPTRFKFYICCLCNQKSTQALCDSCYQYLPIVQNACLACGVNAETMLCGHCLSSPPIYTRTISCFWYEEPLKTLIHDYKFKQKLFLTPVFGKYLTEKIKIHYQDQNLKYPEMIIPMPIHKKRLCERGYHQVYELAKMLHKHLSLPVNLNFCKRMQHTLPQSLLPFSERKKNVEDIFETKKIPYQHIAILDDVITTGETIHSLSHAFIQKNPSLCIDVWSLARTKNHH